MEIQRILQYIKMQHFFVKGDKNLDKVIKNIEKLDIDWEQYNLIKSSNNYPALQQSISGIYKIGNKLFAGSLLFAGVTVSLLLFLWMNARKKRNCNFTFIRNFKSQNIRTICY